MQEESKSVIIASKDALPKLFTVLSETSIGIKKQLLSSPLSPIESITSLVKSAVERAHPLSFQSRFHY